MGYDSTTDRLISIKKLAGKSHTSNEKGLSNEGLPSGVTISSETVFGETITSSPSSTAIYTITGKVEYLRFPVSFVAGSDSGSGRHGFALQLPADYEGQSSNSKAGTYPFENDQVINITSGSLQLVPTSFATAYEVKPYYGGNTVKDSGTQIPVLDARDWYVDYFNGVFFQQDPPGTGDHANNPDFVEGYLYIGDPLSTVVAAAGGDTFKTVAVSGQSNVVADSSTDTLTLVGGSNVTITTNAGTDTVTIAASLSGGAVDTSGTPVDSQLAIFTDADTVEGDANITYDGTTFKVGVSGTGKDVTFYGDVAAAVGMQWDANGTTNGKLTLGADAEGVSFQAYGDTTNNYINWNQSSDTLSLYASAGAINTKGNVVFDIASQGWDFTVNTNNKKAIFVDGSEDQILILSGGATTDPLVGHASAYEDTNFFVSGTLGSMGGAAKGTAVFGGDLLVSGTVALARTADADSAEGLLLGVGPDALSRAYATTDVATWFAGTAGGKDHATDRGVTVFAGDVAVSGSIIPGLDTTVSLGSLTNRFANVYTGDLHLRNDRGDWTIFEEADFLCVVNNSTGKKFKMVLEPID